MMRARRQLKVMVMLKTAKHLDPIPPGQILREEFMRPHGISQNRLGCDIDVNRPGKYFGTTPELRFNLQTG
jgi:plasmid maintenance system antidote protein VapI